MAAFLDQALEHAFDEGHAACFHDLKVDRGHKGEFCRVTLFTAQTFDPAEVRQPAGVAKQLTEVFAFQQSRHRRGK